ncbi:hypothetical protein GBAR_LOCUS20506, partial [Geodia barretti]
MWVLTFDHFHSQVYDRWDIKGKLVAYASITVAWSYPSSMATSANNGFPPFDNSLVENRDQEPPTIQEFYSNDATEDSAAVAASVHPDTELIAQA